MMKAFLLDAYRKDALLRAAEVAEPVLRDDDILVEVHAAGLNPLDAKIRDGAFKLLLAYKPPFVLGHDVAGIVLRVGPKVTRFRVGDAIYARPRDGRIGTLAERIAVAEADAALKPTNLSMEEAASIPLVGLTAWQALVERAGLKAGQKVFIQAGSGGVGSFAIQLAAHLGATVATTAGVASTGRMHALGANTVIDYKAQDVADILSGQDVVLHNQDNATLRRSLRVLRPGGQLVSISGPPDPDFARAQNLGWPLRLGIRALSAGIRRRAASRGLHYSFLFMRADGTQLATIAMLIENDVIRPVLDQVFPFEATNDAMVRVGSGRAKGKIVVRLR